MSNFFCEKCGKAILEGPSGHYVTECEHYPLEGGKKINKDRSLESWAKLILGDRYGKPLKEEGEKKMLEPEDVAFDPSVRNEEKEFEPLYEFYVAGVKHHQLHTCIQEMAVGDVLTIVPEPTNEFDPNAIRLEYPSLDQDKNIMLGYIPKAKGDYSSKVSAALMHRNLKCIVTELDPEAKTWEQLKVAIIDADGVPGEEENE